MLFKRIQRYRSETGDEGEYYSFVTKASFTKTELFLICHVARFNLLKEFTAFDVFEDLAGEYKVPEIVRQELPAA
ncbi:hypothetical protein MKJ04_17530 [Pontibacter sp. E15-1]|nr:hypothetical protein [Pontibacter sp. E15-1]